MCRASEGIFSNHAKTALAGLGRTNSEMTFEFFYGIGREQAQCDKDKTDDQAHAALLQKIFQGTARQLGFVGEVVVDRTGQHLAWVAI